MPQTVQHCKVGFTHAWVSRRLIDMVYLTDAVPLSHITGSMKLLAAGERKEKFLNAMCLSPFLNKWSRR